VIDGGSGAPSGNGYIKIYSTGHAFAALKADGSITAWGDSRYGGSGAPSDNGYTKIYSTTHPPKSLKALETSTSAKRHFSTVLSTVFCQ
jgi:alpha-tubulin suppressor-like RCC1 family protein